MLEGGGLCKDLHYVGHVAISWQLSTACALHQELLSAVSLYPQAKINMATDTPEKKPAQELYVDKHVAYIKSLDTVRRPPPPHYAGRPS